MQSSSVWEMSSIDTPKRDTSLLSLLFFMMGAMNIYLFLRRQRDWWARPGRRLFQAALVSCAVATLLEIVL
jgi:hypothetical protein